VRGSCQGKRQIFLRLSGCNLAENHQPCIWCDAPQAHEKQSRDVRVEKIPGIKEFNTFPNPMEVDRVMNVVDELKTPDLHSISITGGEPLHQPEFLEALFREMGPRIYLETNGTLLKAAQKIADHIDFASVDIKDETALPYVGWRDIVVKELKTIKIFKEAGVMVFAKIVVTNDTQPENISWFAKELKEVEVPLAIQPVTTKVESEKVSGQKLFKLTEAAAQYLSADDISISLQTHKYYGVL
jgi:organic radical activating enzyme